MINYTDTRYSFENGDLVISTTKDVAVVDKNEAILQAIMLRLLTPKGKYTLNPNLGSELHALTKEKSTSITEDRLRSIIINAIKPEIDSGNITDDVQINIERVNDKINIAVVLNLLDGTKEQINLILQ
jgi:phage gp46-like protein